jgi:exosortase family protein XrtM
VFLLLFAGLQLGWQALSGTSVQSFIVHDCTVRPAAVLVNLLTPGVQAQAVNSRLTARGGSLNIINGCEGTEVLFLLSAGLAVVPIPWKRRVLGFLLGTPVVYVVNQARILALFYAYRTNTSLFDLLHGTVTPIAVVLLVSWYFYAWLVYSRKSI